MAEWSYEKYPWNNVNRLRLIYALAACYSKHPPAEGYAALLERIAYLAGASDLFLEANRVNFRDVLSGIFAPSPPPLC